MIDRSQDEHTRSAQAGEAMSWEKPGQTAEFTGATMPETASNDDEMAPA